VLVAEAYGIIGDVLAPLPVGDFFDKIVGQQFIKVAAQPINYRTTLLGPNPEDCLLSAFAAVAPKITSHAAAPVAPPPRSEPVASKEAFRSKIEAFHTGGYTVRIPDLRSLSPGLDAFMRALEIVLHQRVEAAAFWSRGDAEAPLHHDDQDIVVIQLQGRKRWHISSGQSPLPNVWKSRPSESYELQSYTEVEVGPGDLLYLPRGTAHRVDALSDSLHLSIGFVPLTLREAVIATLDHLSDLDRPWREGVSKHLALDIRRNDFNDLPTKVRAALGQMAHLAEDDGFIAQALQRRSSRVIGDLNKMAPSTFRPPLNATTLLRHATLATCHLSADDDRLDVSYPGGHIYVHRAVEQSVLFIVHTSQFRIQDIPGVLTDEVREALVAKFVDSGFLHVVLES